MNTVNDFIAINNPDATDYQKFLVSFIFDIAEKNVEAFNYNNINDIAIAVYMYCKDMKTDPTVSDSIFIDYFNRKYGYGSLIHKLVLDISDKKPDLIELISEISHRDFSTSFMSVHDFVKHVEVLYNTEKMSEEENKETLLFGDNILYGEMTVRELSDTVRMMTIEFVKEYITDLNLGDISFTISDSSIMYLKDTDGIKVASMYTKEGNKHIVRYTTEDGSALFLLFEPVNIRTETIYGLSLDAAADGERGLLILEKDKDDSIYRLLFGKGGEF